MAFGSIRTTLLAFACAAAIVSPAMAEDATVESAPATPAAAAATAEPPPSEAVAQLAPAAPEAPAQTAAAPPEAGPPPTRSIGANSLPVVAPGMAQVVFFRPSRLGGMALAFSVRENGVGLGKLGNGSYFVIDAPPGEHTYTIESEAKDSLILEVDAGETYYVVQNISVGVMVGRPHLTPTSADAFGAKKLKLSTRTPKDDPDLAQNKTAAIAK